ncbi:MAG: hypothetical protein C5B54_02955 [Acidobacteria bacterium]|nr:MAG: hypothetical protein C5B54_02955 [Acidobacteriota bacterium]
MISSLSRPEFCGCMNKQIKVCLWLIFVLRSSLALGITDEEIFRNFQFSFVNPGARASAMGNAFIALADDATAAEANPAGLTILTKPEVSFEYRNIRFDAQHLNSLNEVSVPLQETTITTSNDLQTLNRPSFWSFVYPRHGTTFAVSMQEAVRLQGNIDEDFHLLLIDQSTGQHHDLQFAAIGNTDQKVVNWNFSVARKITDRLSIGLTLRLSTLDWQAGVDNSYFDGGIKLPFTQTAIDDSDHAFAWNAGAIYRIGSNMFLGAVYKRNARFQVTEVESGSQSLKPGPFRNVLKIPDIFGTGFAIRPNDSIVLSSDLVRIQYSDLMEAFQAGRNVVTFDLTNEDIHYGIEDGWEFHFGSEFIVLLKNLPIAMRQGYYRKKSNSLFLVSAPGVSPSDLAIYEAIFKKGEDENHLTLGAGVVFTNFQVDCAFDASKSTTHFVLSTVVRF